MRQDARAHRPVALRIGRGQTDQALAALRVRGGRDEVQLPAGAGDLPRAGGLGGDLPVKVDLDGVVQADHVVVARDDIGVVGVVHRGEQTVGVAVEEVVELFRAHGKGIDDLPGVGGLVFSADAARLRHRHVSVAQHFGMHAQILQSRLGYQLSDGVRHRADAELDTGAVADKADDQLRDLFVHLRRRGRRHLDDRPVRPLYEAVDLGDVYLALFIAEGPRDAAVDFRDHPAGVFQIGRHDGRGGAQTDVALLIRRRHHDHQHVDRMDQPVSDGLRPLMVVHRDVAAQTVIA